MFTFVNEIAVLGTAFFMVAVAMIWYSDYCFRKQWMRAVGFTAEDVAAGEQHIKRNFVLTFISYAVAILLIALFIGYAEVFGMSVRAVALALSMGFGALFAGFVVWEQRSLTYYLITVGFSSVFITGSVFLLYYWPW